MGRNLTSFETPNSGSRANSKAILCLLLILVLLGCWVTFRSHSPDLSLQHLGIGVWAMYTGLYIFTTSPGTGEGGPAFSKAEFVSLPPLEHEHLEDKGALLFPLLTLCLGSEGLRNTDGKAGFPPPLLRGLK